MSFAPYETVYRSPLLDEIHNYFPALLYAPDEFSNTRDVLNYIQEQTRLRYDLFSYGRRRFRETASQTSQATSSSARTSYAPAPASGVRQQRMRPATLPTLVSEEYEEEDEDGNTVTTTFRITETNPAASSVANAAPDHAYVPSILTSLLAPPTPQEETRAAQILLSLLGQPIHTAPPSARGSDFLWNQFFQPVLVRPSAEQIRQFTTIGQVPDTVDVCAICQDNFDSNRQGRLLNPCGHWFHQNCIDTWFQGNVRCPICRHDIRTPSSPALAPRSAPTTTPPSMTSQPPA
jgi:hypothetical protein